MVQIHQGPPTLSLSNWGTGSLRFGVERGWNNLPSRVEEVGGRLVLQPLESGFDYAPRVDRLAVVLKPSVVVPLAVRYMLGGAPPSRRLLQNYPIEPTTRPLTHLLGTSSRTARPEDVVLWGAPVPF